MLRRDGRWARVPSMKIFQWGVSCRVAQTGVVFIPRGLQKIFAHGAQILHVLFSSLALAYALNMRAVKIEKFLARV